jgi:hypothetical protein
VTIGVALAAWLAASLVAQATDLGPYAQIANYGILGLIALALFQGRVVPAKQYDQAIADRDREHGELVALRQRTEEQIIPAMVRSTEILGQFVNAKPPPRGRAA